MSEHGGHGESHHDSHGGGGGGIFGEIGHLGEKLVTGEALGEQAKGAADVAMETTNVLTDLLKPNDGYNGHSGGGGDGGGHH